MIRAVFLAAAILAGATAPASALPRFVCQEAGEVAQEAMAYRQAGYDREALMIALQPRIEDARSKAKLFGISDTQFNNWLRLAENQLVPILYNIRIQRTQKARDRMAVLAGELAFARCVVQ